MCGPGLEIMETMMSDDLTKEQREELNRLTVAMAEEAISVRMDYEENGSNLDSGSVVAIHHNSPLLDDENTELGTTMVVNTTQRIKKYLENKDDDDFDIEEYYKMAGIDIPENQYRFLAEGGDVEPVAKKTMPLLDMDGQEMDFRQEGGFVPIGRMEKADDVPARLSKNEFVFTADAVRNAGGGDVDKGAEVMYNTMKNLEAGGEVSEETQGLEGAKQMFQTSQRLGEVV